ncbi:ribosome small subunit-dependent GTPase A [Actinomadura rayongensis]|uniref:Small ribosomal subunit biogenesis GTPase RsgA n=1 Tax=Actinomadura rayongensis TaxID=1429076 RepID=A0A6I4WHF7_9ACTN|nr:ribosome small subunit-dependent GTPase A [Actinomadura rayongensis]MXQ67266.1 ribosome small subunit-dependent GTPase A [Actinomadura rayongensis]
MDFPHDLLSLGWDEDWNALFTPHRAAGLVPARITAVDRGRCDAHGPDGPLRAACAPALAPCTGDWAALTPEEPHVAALLPRRTAIVRASAGRTSEGQVLAANVDTVAVVAALDRPVNPGRIERTLALAWESGARPVIVLTKADRSPDPAADAAEAAAAAPGVDVRTVAALDGTGLDAVRALLTGTVALLGPSGAGKSTLANALLGADRLATGAVRAADGKGRHTTVRRELHPLPGGGALIDTPGLRGVGLHDAADGIRHVFADIEDLAVGCRFADCAHVAEPGCAVLAAVASGALPARRLDGYRRLLREDEWARSRDDARLRAERTGRHKKIVREQRRLYRERGAREDGR